MNSEDEYREALALANLSPGPLAAQLAIYLGLVHHSFWKRLWLVSPSFFRRFSWLWRSAGPTWKFGGLSWPGWWCGLPAIHVSDGAPAFIGYLVAGLPGAIFAAVATFLPAYILTVFPAPYFRKYGSRPTLAAIVDGVTAAPIGAIAGAVIVLGRRAIIDLTTGLLALAALLILWKSPRRIPEPLIVAAAAIFGLFVYPG